MRKIITAFSLSIFSVLSFSQQRTCGTDDVINHFKSTYEKYEQNRTAINAHYENYKQNFQEASTRAVVTIPVVVHVVYNNTSQNVSDAQIQSQIDVLNADFRRLNADANNNWTQAADAEFEFCLASLDPQGQATSGITRTQTSITAFNSGDNRLKSTAQGGKTGWSPNDYLNIWVCNLGGGLLGYATPPGGPSSQDGVVIGYNNFGTTGAAVAPFNLGRTGTHEVGHWLNLEHVWGNGCGVDDGIADTPDQASPHYGCPSAPNSCGSADMSENYMDYVNDGCMNLFTAGQKTRMQSLFSSGGWRASILNSNGCGGNPGGGGGGGQVAGSGTCADPFQIVCGTTYSGSTNGFTNSVSSYSCQTWLENGPELFMEVNLSQAENLQVTLTSVSGGDLDVGILSSCNPVSCIDLGDNSASSTVGAGKYYIVIDGYEGATGNFSVQATCNSSIAPSAINENVLANQVSLYPNPALNELTINAEDLTIQSIKIIDLTGKMVLSNSFNQSSKTIDISSLDKGSYILMLDSEKGLVSKKFVKK